MVEEKKKYTCDNSDLYWIINKIYFRGPEYIKASLTLFYKKGIYKGYRVEKSKKYSLYRKNIGHWIEF